ncbi:MAG: carbon starvation protein A, partial [Phycisphaerales bacterium]|nr:carbon starvation protein A [Phycisphaerales bacterium]
MPAIVLMLIAIVVTVVAYFTYGSFVARRLAISNDHETPAHTRADGVDYVAAPAPVVLGHHFASIAGAGPIVGPIVAVAFGWLPAFLWILVGVVFIG